MVFHIKNMEKTNLINYNRLMREYKESQHTLLYKSNSDLSFYSAGYEECSPGYSYGPKFRAYQLIHFVINGSGRLHINEHIFELSAGDAFLIPSGKISYYEASREDPWTYAWISFMGINSETCLYQLMTSVEDIYIIHDLDVEKYKESILKILAIEGNPTSQYFQANSILLHIISQLFNDIDFQEESWGKDSAADEVKFYLDTNYAEKIVLKDVARSFGIHPNYLTRTFHEKFGISPKKYLMELKLKKACRLLTTTELPISLISSSLGFDDQLAFSRLFKKEFSDSPSAYRKKSRDLAVSDNS